MKKLFIDYHKRRTQVALVEDGELVEFQVERQSTPPIVGNIYKGKVVNVLQGMKAAFVNIGLEKNAFLYVGEPMIDNKIYNKNGNKEPAKTLKVSPGDEIICQVVKAEFGTKGARINTNISIPGRLLVYMPQSNYIGVSHKIEDDETRERLEETARDILKDYSGGVIVRTACRNASKEQIKNELERLIEIWKDIIKKEKIEPAFSKLYEEGDLVYRSIRDLIDNDLDKIVLNNQEFADLIKPKIDIIAPKKDMVEVYNGGEDFFSYYRISSQVEKMLKRKVVLKNGAYLVIDRTEALTTIDVNTGKFVGENDLEQTVFEANRIAAIEIARQLRLRNIGGIVIVDFIDMYTQAHRDEIMETMRQSLKKDRIKTTVVSMTNLGLMEITRKKTRRMIDSVLLKPCPYCHGDSYVYSDEYMLSRVSEALKNTIYDLNPQVVLLTVNPDIFAKLFTLRYLENECETIWKNIRIYVVSDSSMHIEKFLLKTYDKQIVDLPNTAKLLF